MAKAGRGDDQYMVRFPEGLRDKVKAAAADNSRSMNSEIVARLEETFRSPFPDMSGYDLAAMVKRLDATVRALEHLFVVERDMLSGWEDVEPTFEQIRAVREAPSKMKRDVLARLAERDLAGAVDIAHQARSGANDSIPIAPRPTSRKTTAVEEDPRLEDVFKGVAEQLRGGDIGGAIKTLGTNPHAFAVIEKAMEQARRLTDEEEEKASSRSSKRRKTS